MSALQHRHGGPVDRGGAAGLLRASSLPPLAAAMLVAMPLLSLARIALDGDPELWPHLAAFVLPAALRQTVALLVGTAVLTAVVGAGTAWLVTSFQFPGRSALLWLLPLPLAIPTYIAAYIYTDLLDAADAVLPPARSLAGAIFIFAVVLYPYVYLAARAMFQMHFAALTDAGRMLGARPWRLARDITLPMARPALAVGLALVMLETVNDIGASEYLGVQTLTLSIFTTWLNRGSLGGAAQIAIALLAIVILLIMLERYGRRRQFTMSTQDTRTSEPIVLRGRTGWLAALACVLPVLLGFILPAGYLLRETVARGLLSRLDGDLLHHAATTVGLAGTATCAVLLIGLATVMPLRTHGHPALRVCVATASLGYAVPGTVLALGLLSPLVAVDELINWLAALGGGHHAGLLLAGSSVGLIIAYCIRFLAVAIGFVQSGLTRVPPDMDEAAQLLGARPLTRFRNIQLPMVRPALWGAALLIFVDCLKELPATLLLRPLNVETLATYIYQFASRGNFEEGALAALLIVAAGVIPVIRLVYLAENATRMRVLTAPRLSPAMQP